MARDSHFTFVDGTGIQAQRALLRAVELVALTQDSQLAAQAQPLASDYRNIPRSSWFLAPMLTLAANADPKLLQSLFDELARRDAKDEWRRASIIDALSRVRGIVGVFKRDPGKVSSIGMWETWKIFERACDVAERKDLADLRVNDSTGALARVLPRVDDCVAKKTRLEPGLRTWLSRLKPH